MITRRPRIPFQPQLDASDCGAAALVTVLRYHGLPGRMDEVRGHLRTSRGGVSARSLVDTARRLGLTGTGVRAPVSTLHRLAAGTILFWRGNHFVVLERVGARSAIIVDPSIGRRAVSLHDLGESYSGIAITFTGPEPDAGRSRPARSAEVPSPLPAIRLFVPANWRWIAVLTCSLVLILQTALTPLFVDHLARGSARDSPPGLGTLLAIGLPVLALHACGQFVRNAAVVALQGMSDRRSTLTILRRILRVPMDFAARRTSGDLTMRVRTSYVVREALSGTLVTAVLDGFLTLVYLGILTSIDRVLSAVVLALVVLQVSVAALVWRRQRLLNATAIHEQTRSQSELFEILQGLETIKSLGLEQVAEERFASTLEREVSTRSAARRNLGSARAATSLIQFAAPLIVLGAGTLRIEQHQSTVGVALAFAAVALGVFTPLGSMLEAMLQLSSLRIHLARVTDVLNARQEDQGLHRVGRPGMRPGALAFRGVTFGYTSGPPVLREVTFDVAPGQIAIVSGDSGAGKSTLAMLAAGMVDPADGQVNVDGRDLGTTDKQWMRRRIGYVAQSSHFFSGTLRENIDLGNDYTDAEVREAAAIAGIAELIEGFPMRYQTSFTAGTCPLSGGQRQRLALARALVRTPPILILDEATNALDLGSERRVLQRIADLGCTVLLISHRPYGELTGDRRLVVEHGRVHTEASPDRIAAGAADHRRREARAG
jgi:ABC-type bacteriocin/lantibiotic exporter with double-glycine peptidase domain